MSVTTYFWKREGGALFDLFRLLCHGLMLAIFLGFLGAVLPVGDSLAIFRIEFTVLLAAAAVVAARLGRALIPLLALITICASLISLLPFAGRGADVASPDLTLHQHNVLYGNGRLDTLLEALSKIDADVITLQEVSEVNFAKIRAALGAEYPHYQACLYSRGGVAVMMRGPGRLIDYGCLPKSRMAWMRVETDAGPVTAGSIHLLWPWPMGQFWQTPDFEQEIAELPGPLVLGGDFNNVPWSAAVRGVARSAGGRLARGLAPSFIFPVPWPRFRIDHVIVPQGAEVRAELTPGWGSDHRGVTARIKLP